MRDLTLLLWQLGGAGLALALWSAATAAPPVRTRLWSWDAPIVGAIGILLLVALVMGAIGLVADRAIVYAPLGVVMVFMAVILGVLSLFAFHRGTLDRAGPALTAMLLPVLLAMAVAVLLLVVRLIAGALVWLG